MSNAEQELEALEQELRQLKPAAPSPELELRITEELHAPSRKGRWVVSGLAAALLLGLGLYSAWSPAGVQDEQPQVAEINWQPIQEPVAEIPELPRITTEQLVVNRQDEGVVHIDGMGPMRKVRLF